MSQFSAAAAAGDEPRADGAFAPLRNFVPPLLFDGFAQGDWIWLEDFREKSRS